jgi:hypothetical protein
LALAEEGDWIIKILYTRDEDWKLVWNTLYSLD